MMTVELVHGEWCVLYATLEYAWGKVRRYRIIENGKCFTLKYKNSQI